VEDWWLEGDFAADEGACRDQLHQVIARAQSVRAVDSDSVSTSDPEKSG
jgi:hypothetical protein